MFISPPPKHLPTLPSLTTQVRLPNCFLGNYNPLIQKAKQTDKNSNLKKKKPHHKTFKKYFHGEKKTPPE